MLNSCLIPDQVVVTVRWLFMLRPQWLPVCLVSLHVNFVVDLESSNVRFATNMLVLMAVSLQIVNVTGAIIVTLQPLKYALHVMFPAKLVQLEGLKAALSVLPMPALRMFRQPHAPALTSTSLSLT